jgi:hypothetical protein
MCVEAAICYALGYEHGDQPKCVANCIRTYKIAINDVKWSSNAARAVGMRRAAIAQLGSDFLDLPENRDQRTAFVTYLAEQVIRQIVPIPLRLVAEKYKKQIGAENAARLIEAALKCEQEGTEASAQEANDAANAAANAANAATYATYAAYAANDAYANAAAYAAYANAAANAANAATYAAYAANDAANAAAYAAKRDEILSIAAEICVRACIKCKTPGSKWLDLAPKQKAA